MVSEQELAEQLEEHGARIARKAINYHYCSISTSDIAASANCFAVAAALKARAIKDTTSGGE
jgi:hypothetical protein